MRLYETTFLINPQTDDVTIDRQVNDVIDIIKANDGKLIHEDRMGTRRMAYAINGLNQAYYTSLLFESEVKALAPLDRHYRLGEAYLRSLTILFDGDVDRVINDEEQTNTRPRGAVPPPPPRPKPAPPAGDGPVGRRESESAAAPAEAAKEEPKAEEPKAEEAVAEPTTAAAVEPTTEAAAEPVAETAVEEPEKKTEEPSGDAAPSNEDNEL